MSQDENTKPPPPSSFGGSIINPANALTTVRLLLVPLLAWYVVGDQWLHAAVTITFAIITDIYDGKLARLYNSASPLGGFFDHGTDALLERQCLGSGGSWSHPPVALAFHLIRLCAVRIRLQHPAGTRAAHQ